MDLLTLLYRDFCSSLGSQNKILPAPQLSLVGSAHASLLGTVSLWLPFYLLGLPALLSVSLISLQPFASTMLLPASAGQCQAIPLSQH